VIRGAKSWSEVAEQARADRSRPGPDLEIAGADDVVYGDVVQTIEIAAKAGFTDWKVLPPAALAARPGP